ncbi:MAG: glycine cleavage system protein GcvH [Phycisphaerae bacterium]
MKPPNDRVYRDTHEWFVAEGDIVTMGVTQYAADELTDITYVDLPEVGTSVAPDEVVGEVESVKATSEIYSAVGGQVTEVNAALVDHPELINDDAYEDGWLLRIKADSVAPLKALMTAAEYAEHVAS